MVIAVVVGRRPAAGVRLGRPRGRRGPRGAGAGARARRSSCCWRSPSRWRCRWWARCCSSRSWSRRRPPPCADRPARRWRSRASALGPASVWGGLVLASMVDLPPSFFIVTIACGVWLATWRAHLLSAASVSARAAAGDHHHADHEDSLTACRSLRASEPAGEPQHRDHDQPDHHRHRGRGRQRAARTARAASRGTPRPAAAAGRPAATPAPGRARAPRRARAARSSGAAGDRRQQRGAAHLEPPPPRRGGCGPLAHPARGAGRCAGPAARAALLRPAGGVALAPGTSVLGRGGGGLQGTRASDRRRG